MSLDLSSVKDAPYSSWVVRAAGPRRCVTCCARTRPRPSARIDFIPRLYRAWGDPGPGARPRHWGAACSAWRPCGGGSSPSSRPTSRPAGRFARPLSCSTGGRAPGGRRRWGERRPTTSPTFWRRGGSFPRPRWFTSTATDGTWRSPGSSGVRPDERLRRRDAWRPWSAVDGGTVPSTRLVPGGSLRNAPRRTRGDDEVRLRVRRRAIRRRGPDAGRSLPVVRAPEGFAETVPGARRCRKTTRRSGERARGGRTARWSSPWPVTCGRVRLRA